MKNMFISLGCLLLFLTWACNNPEASTEGEASTPAFRPTSTEPLQLTVNIDHFRMRAQPALDAAVVHTLRLGEQVQYLGEQSSFTTRITLRQVPFDEPWLKVRTKEGQEGWIFAGGVHFDPNTTLQGHNLMQLRLQQFFGVSLAQSVEQYRLQFGEAKTDAQLAQAYFRSQLLRDSLNMILGDKLRGDGFGTEVPDMTWLQWGFPGFQAGLAAEGTILILYTNYKEWSRRALQTTGQEDEQFFALQFEIFPLDSIEQDFPSWQIPVADYVALSKLGEGRHRQLLERANQLEAEGSLFDAPIDQLKDHLVQDILDSPNGYWNKQELILQELDQILEAPFGILTPTDREKLEERRKSFEKPEENEIDLNNKPKFGMD